MTKAQIVLVTEHKVISWRMKAVETHEVNGSWTTSLTVSRRQCCSIYACCCALYVGLSLSLRLFIIFISIRYIWFVMLPLLLLLLFGHTYHKKVRRSKAAVAEATRAAAATASTCPCVPAPAFIAYFLTIQIVLRFVFFFMLNNISNMSQKNCFI